MSVSLNTMKHIWLFNRIVATTYSLLRTYDTYGTFKGTAIRTLSGALVVKTECIII